MTRFTLKTLCGAKKHTRYISLFLITGLIISFTACEDKAMDMSMNMRSLEAGNQIEFKTTLQTRSAENLLFELGDTIGIYSVIWQPDNQTPGELQSSGNYDDNKPYNLVDENDNWTSPDPIYYPIDGTKIDLYTYYPWMENPMNSNTAINVSVHEDQRALENYKRSDFKAAVSRGLNYESGPFHFDFYHRFSQVKFEIVAGTGVRPEQLTAAQIKLTNVIINGTYSFTGGSPDNVTTGSRISDITPCGMFQLENNKVTGKAAIIVPQTLSSGSRIEVIFANRTISADFAGQVTFGMGESRLITITLTANGIDFTTEIKPWDEQPPVEEKDLLGYLDVNCESGNTVEFFIRTTKKITFNWGDEQIESVGPFHGYLRHTYNASDKRIFNVRIYGEKDALAFFVFYGENSNAIVQGNVFFDSNTLQSVHFGKESNLRRVTSFNLSKCPQLRILLYSGDKDNKYPLKIQLPQNSILETLLIHHTDSLKITPLFSSYPNLILLELIDVELKAIDVANLSQLRHLKLNSNKDLTEVELCPNVVSLELNECINLKEIDIRNCSNLQNIFIQESGIENIISDTNPSILGLYASKSNISELDLSFCPRLYDIRIDETLISELDFSNNQNVGVIQCQNTPLNDNEDALLRMAYSLPNRYPYGGNLYVNPNAVSVIDSICTKKSWRVTGM